MDSSTLRREDRIASLSGNGGTWSACLKQFVPVTPPHVELRSAVRACLPLVRREIPKFRNERVEAVERRLPFGEGYSSSGALAPALARLCKRARPSSRAGGSSRPHQGQDGGDVGSRSRACRSFAGGVAHGATLKRVNDLRCSTVAAGAGESPHRLAQLPRRPALALGALEELVLLAAGQRGDRLVMREAEPGAPAAGVDGAGDAGDVPQPPVREAGRLECERVRLAPRSSLAVAEPVAQPPRRGRRQAADAPAELEPLRERERLTKDEARRRSADAGDVESRPACAPERCAHAATVAASSAR
jgi:hypothetical protein